MQTGLPGPVLSGPVVAYNEEVMARSLLTLLRLRPAARSAAADSNGALPRRGLMQLGIVTAVAALLPWRPRRRRRRGEAPPTGWFGHC